MLNFREEDCRSNVNQRLYCWCQGVVDRLRLSVSYPD